jgi:Uma2 family endonuclease
MGAPGLLDHPWITRRKLDIVEYHRMAAAGILTDRDRVELIEGELIEMAPIGDEHARVTALLFTRIAQAVGARAIVSPGNPIRLGPHSEPQPDCMVLRREAFSRPRPLPSDVILLVEVSDSSLRFDRAVKLPLYAASGIAEVWIVNLVAREIEVCQVIPVSSASTPMRKSRRKRCRM